MGRKLTPEEAAAEGLPPPPSAKRKLTREEALAEGLPLPPEPVKAPPAKQEMNPLSAAGHKFLEGYFQNFSDEGAGALTPLMFGARSGGDPNARLRNPVTGEIAKAGDTAGLYKAGRDIERQNLQAADEALGVLKYPVGVAGNVAGALTGTRLLGPLAKSLGGLRGAMGMGAVSGFGAGEGSALPQALAALAGAGGGAGGYGIGKGLGLAADKLGISDWFRQKGVEGARRVLTGGAESLSTKKPVSDKALELVLREKGIGYTSTVEDAAKRIGALSDDAGAQLTRVLKSLDEAGVKGPDATKLGTQLIDEAAQIEANSLDNPIPKQFMDIAEELGKKPVDEAGRLGLLQSESMKRGLQKIARKEYKNPSATLGGEGKMAVANRVMQANEKAVEDAAAAAPAGSVVRELGEQFKPSKVRSGLFQEAEEVALKGARQASKRSFISPTDYLTLAATLPVAYSSGRYDLLALPIINHLMRSRGGSTWARGAFDLGDALTNQMGNVGALTSRTPDSYTAKLIEELRRREGAQP